MLFKSLKNLVCSLPVALHFLHGKPFLLTLEPSHLKQSGRSSLSSSFSLKSVGPRIRQLTSFSVPMVSFWQAWVSVLILVLHITSLKPTLAYEPISFVAQIASMCFSDVVVASVLQPKLFCTIFFWLRSFTISRASVAVELIGTSSMLLSSPQAIECESCTFELESIL